MNINTTTATQGKSVQCTMETAKEWLDDHGVRYQQKTPYQLKMGAVNFYPTTGKITIDGEPPYPDKGLHALRGVLEFARVMG